MYKCETCKKDFKYKSQYTRHKNLKFGCDYVKNTNKKINNIKNEISSKLQNSINNNSINNNKCLFCNSIFSTKGNLTKHLNNSCNIKKKLETEKNEINKDKITYENIINSEDKKEIKLLRNTIAKLLKNQSIKNQSNNITINNTINNNLTVNINSFGKEDLSHITLEDYKKYLNGFFKGFIEFIEKVHFDKNSPKNHNISITNLKSKYLSIFTDGKWFTRDKNDIIDNLIIKKYNMLNDICDELEERNQISKKIVDNFSEFTQNYDNEEAQKNTKNDIILMIYNNKDKIK
jgi:uncharacterized C2H2 Zn-finger protein